MKKDMVMEFVNEGAREVFEKGVNFFALDLQINQAEARRAAIKFQKNSEGALVERTDLSDTDKDLIAGYDATIQTLKAAKDALAFSEDNCTVKDLHIMQIVARFNVEGVAIMYSGKSKKDSFSSALENLVSISGKYINFLQTCPQDTKTGMRKFDAPTKDAFKDLQAAIKAYLNDNLAVREEGEIFKSNLFKPVEWYCNAGFTHSVADLYSTVLRVDKDGKVSRRANTAGFRKICMIILYAKLTGQTIEAVREEVK